MVIWVDMQINISHLQPPLGRARGQKDEVQPIQSLIQIRRAVEEVQLGFRFRILPLNQVLSG